MKSNHTLTMYRYNYKMFQLSCSFRDFTKGLVSHGFAFFLFFKVLIEEVNIKACLKHCCGRLGPAKRILLVIAIDPIFVAVSSL